MAGTTTLFSMRFLIVLLALGAHAAAAQTPADTLDFSEVSPVLLGGIEAFQADIRYPEFEQRHGIEGRVIIRFVVLTDGTTTAIELVRSVSPGLDSASVAAVRAARFTPGTQNGAPVNVRQTLPVSFRITDDAPGQSFDATVLLARLGEPWLPTVAPDSGAVVAGAGRLVWQAGADRVEAHVEQGTLRTVTIVYGDARGQTMRTLRERLAENRVRLQPDGFYFAQDLAQNGLNGQFDMRLDGPRLVLRQGTCQDVPGYGCVRDFPVLIGGVRGLQERTRYPRRAQEARLGGQIIVVFVVQPDGTPADVRVASDTVPDGGAIGRSLREAALDAVRASRFVPAQRGGSPVAAPAAVPISFRIN